MHRSTEPAKSLTKNKVKYKKQRKIKRMEIRNLPSHLQSILESIIQFHNGSLVTTAIAVVGCTKNGHHILFMAPVVALWGEVPCSNEPNVPSLWQWAWLSK